MAAIYGGLGYMKQGELVSTSFQRARSGALILAVALAAAACGGPLDKDLVTGEGVEPYRESLAVIENEASEFEIEAFNWAVSDFDLDRLHREYPGSTPRKVIRTEVQKVKDTYPERIEALEELAEEQGPVREELGKIVATDAKFFIEKDFFGLQPKIRASIINGSSLPVSGLEWTASLYIDGAAEPVVTKVLSNDYRRNGGLEPGDAYTVTFKIGHVRGDDRWTTLEIRNAETTRVVLEAVPGSVKDFGDRRYLPTDPIREVKLLQAGLEAAEKYAEI